MKTKYIKGITGLCLTALMFFSACLKDDKFLFDPTAVQATIAEMPLSGLANFSKDAITAPGPLDTVLFVVNIASVDIPTTATSVTVAVDNSLIAPYNAANTSIVYLPMPTAAYKLPVATATIPAGSRQVILKVIVDKSKLDPASSYMLPVALKDASGIPISANFGVHYYHVIGNDFAGVYKWDFTRVPAAGNFVGRTVTLFPVSPTQFEVVGGYFTGDVKYEVTFTKNSDGTYSNFQVSINKADEANTLNLNGITVTSQPVIIFPGYTSTTKYTYAQAVNGLFTFQYSVLGGSGARVNTDKYYK